CADVVRCDGLVRLISSNRISELPLEDSDLDCINVVVLHKRSGPQEGGWKPELTNVVLDLPLGLPMADAGVSFRSSHRRIDEMRIPSPAAGVRHILALLHLASGTDGPKILNTIDPVNSLNCLFQGFDIIHVPLDHFHTAFR